MGQSVIEKIVRVFGNQVTEISMADSSETEVEVSFKLKKPQTRKRKEASFGSKVGK